MHYHIEIILPPTKDIPSAIAQVLAPFDENNEEATQPFWDFYVIGGRWSGVHMECTFPESAKKAFYADLRAHNVTCSAVTAGKQTIDPASQIPLVDRLFKKHFPNSPTKVCPFFSYYNDQYEHSLYDVCTVGEIPSELTAERVLFCRMSDLEHGGDNLYVHEMYCQSLWDGATWQKCGFSGNVKEAIAKLEAQSSNYLEEWKETSLPKSDWLCVTVDVHS